MTPATVLDHIVALSLGGTHDPANLAPACQECNAEKAKAEQRFLARGFGTGDIMSDPELGEWIRRSQLPR